MPASGDPIDFSQAIATPSGRLGRSAPARSTRRQARRRCAGRRRPSQPSIRRPLTFWSPRDEPPIDYSRAGSGRSGRSDRSTWSTFRRFARRCRAALNRCRGSSSARELDKQTAPLHRRRGSRRVAALGSVEPRRDRHADSVQSRLSRRRRVLHRDVRVRPQVRVRHARLARGLSRSRRRGRRHRGPRVEPG